MIHRTTGNCEWLGMRNKTTGLLITQVAHLGDGFGWGKANFCDN